MSSTDHAHPCNFRVTRILDRGWGELAILYQWDSSSGNLDDLRYCSLFELTHYEGNQGTNKAGFFNPPEPPCMGWSFRTPTDGRTAPIALGCFTATEGWAWDRHKLPGRLLVLANLDFTLRITAVQEYRFHCEWCGIESIVPGAHSGPHPIVREIRDISIQSNAVVWRYTCTKHHHSASLDLSPEGYVADSAEIGFGPWESSPHNFRRKNIDTA